MELGIDLVRGQWAVFAWVSVTPIHRQVTTGRAGIEMTPRNTPRLMCQPICGYAVKTQNHRLSCDSNTS